MSAAPTPTVDELLAENDRLRSVARLLLRGSGPDRLAGRNEAGEWPGAVHGPEHLRIRADRWETAGQVTFWLTKTELLSAADVLEQIPEREATAAPGRAA